MSLFHYETDSEPVAGTLSLQGVWLHNPYDPAGASVNLRYGRALRRSALEVASANNVYSRREYPVATYGPHTQEVVWVAAQVPHGPDHAATLAAVRRLAHLRHPLAFRDNRGRNLHGLLRDYREEDAPYGAQVHFTMSRVDIEQGDDS